MLNYFSHTRKYIYTYNANVLYVLATLHLWHSFFLQFTQSYFTWVTLFISTKSGALASNRLAPVCCCCCKRCFFATYLLRVPWQKQSVFFGSQSQAHTHIELSKYKSNAEAKLLTHVHTISHLYESPFSCVRVCVAARVFACWFVLALVAWQIVANCSHVCGLRWMRFVLLPTCWIVETPKKEAPKAPRRKDKESFGYFL